MFSEGFRLLLAQSAACSSPVPPASSTYHSSRVGLLSDDSSASDTFITSSSDSESDGDHSVGARSITDSSPADTSNHSNDNDSSSSSRSSSSNNNKRKSPPKPMDIEEMVDSSITCCKRLKCIGAFVSGEADVLILRAEQAEMSELTAKSRVDFVRRHIPLVRPEKNKGAMVAAGRNVCNEFFCRAYGVSNNLVQNARFNPGSSTAKSMKRECSGSGNNQKRDVLAFLDGYAKVFGQHMPHTQSTHLYLGCKKELYDTFSEERKKGGLKTISYSYFVSIWRDARRSLKAKSGTTFMKCYICTQHKLTLFGAPGIKATTNVEARKAAQEKYDAHIKIVEQNREVMAANCSAARAAHQDRRPLDYVCIQADAAAQTAFALPMQSTMTHGTDKGYSERQKMMAVLVENMFVEVFLTPQTLGGGSNLVCTALHLAISRIFEQHAPGIAEPRIGTLVVQLDNAVSDNKNNCVISYLSSLVGRGVIGEVEVQFMPVGHTHIRVDQVFSKFSAAAKMRDIFTRDQQAEAFRKAYTTLDVFTTTLRNLGNFKSILTSAGVMNRIPKITSARAFQLRRDGSHQVLVGMKEYMHHDNYTGITADGVFTGEHHPLFVAGIPRVEDAEPFKLNTIDDDTIAKVEQRYKSVFPTVDALYSEEDVRQALKAEMMRSVNLLGAHGEKDWDLPTFWLPCADEGSEDEEPDSGPVGMDVSGDADSVVGSFEEDGDNAGVSNNDDSHNQDDDEAEDGGAEDGLVGGIDDVEGGQGEEEESDDEDADIDLQEKIGHFAFFLAESCPVLVGKVVDVRELEGGKDIRVHWYTPVNNSLRGAAASVSFAQYCNTRVAFSADYVIEEAGGRQRRVPDEDWESVDRVVFWSKRKQLNGNGKRLPKCAVDAVFKAYQQRSADENLLHGGQTE